jgi:uncharacterized membrane protein YoaK (UPF0700 family)
VATAPRWELLSVRAIGGQGCRISSPSLSFSSGSSPVTSGFCARLLIEALLLTVFAFLLAREGSPERNTLAYFGFAALPLLAMGLQNATLREVGRSAFPSTYVTGVLDTLAKSTALAVISREERQINSDTASRVARLWFCYVLGALSGSAGLLVFRAGVLFLPVSVLVVIAARFLSTSGRQAG